MPDDLQAILARHNFKGINVANFSPPRAHVPAPSRQPYQYPAPLSQAQYPWSVGGSVGAGGGSGSSGGMQGASMRPSFAWGAPPHPRYTIDPRHYSYDIWGKAPVYSLTGEDEDEEEVDDEGEVDIGGVEDGMVVEETVEVATEASESIEVDQIIEDTAQQAPGERARMSTTAPEESTLLDTTVETAGEHSDTEIVLAEQLLPGLSEAEAPSGPTLVSAAGGEEAAPPVESAPDPDETEPEASPGSATPAPSEGEDPESEASYETQASDTVANTASEDNIEAVSTSSEMAAPENSVSWEPGVVLDDKSRNSPADDVIVTQDPASTVADQTESIEQDPSMNSAEPPVDSPAQSIEDVTEGSEPPAAVPKEDVSPEEDISLQDPPAASDSTSSDGNITPDAESQALAAATSEAGNIVTEEPNIEAVDGTDLLTEASDEPAVQIIDVGGDGATDDTAAILVLDILASEPSENDNIDGPPPPPPAPHVTIAEPIRPSKHSGKGKPGKPKSWKSQPTEKPKEKAVEIIPLREGKVKASSKGKSKNKRVKGKTAETAVSVVEEETIPPPPPIIEVPPPAPSPPPPGELMEVVVEELQVVNADAQKEQSKDVVAEDGPSASPSAHETDTEKIAKPTEIPNETVEALPADEINATPPIEAGEEVDSIEDTQSEEPPVVAVPDDKETSDDTAGADITLSSVPDAQVMEPTEAGVEGIESAAITLQTPPLDAELVDMNLRADGEVEDGESHVSAASVADTEDVLSSHSSTDAPDSPAKNSESIATEPAESAEADAAGRSTETDVHIPTSGCVDGAVGGPDNVGVLEIRETLKESIYEGPRDDGAGETNAAESAESKPSDGPAAIEGHALETAGTVSPAKIDSSDTERIVDQAAPSDGLPSPTTEIGAERTPNLPELSSSVSPAEADVEPKHDGETALICHTSAQGITIAEAEFVEGDVFDQVVGEVGGSADKVVVVIRPDEEDTVAVPPEAPMPPGNIGTDGDDDDRDEVEHVAETQPLETKDDMCEEGRMDSRAEMDAAESQAEATIELAPTQVDSDGPEQVTVDAIGGAAHFIEPNEEATSVPPGGEESSVDARSATPATMHEENVDASAHSGKSTASEDLDSSENATQVIALLPGDDSDAGDAADDQQATTTLESMSDKLNSADNVESPIELERKSMDAGENQEIAATIQENKPEEVASVTGDLNPRCEDPATSHDDALQPGQQQEILGSPVVEVTSQPVMDETEVENPAVELAAVQDGTFCEQSSDPVIGILACDEVAIQESIDGNTSEPIAGDSTGDEACDTTIEPSPTNAVDTAPASETSSPPDEATNQYMLELPEDRILEADDATPSTTRVCPETERSACHESSEQMVPESVQQVEAASIHEGSLQGDLSMARDGETAELVPVESLNDETPNPDYIPRPTQESISSSEEASAEPTEPAEPVAPEDPAQEPLAEAEALPADSLSQQGHCETISDSEPLDQVPQMEQPAPEVCPPEPLPNRVPSNAPIDGPSRISKGKQPASPPKVTRQSSSRRHRSSRHTVKDVSRQAPEPEAAPPTQFHRRNSAVIPPEPVRRQTKTRPTRAELAEQEELKRRAAKLAAQEAAVQRKLERARARLVLEEQERQLQERQDELARLAAEEKERKRARDEQKRRRKQEAMEQDRLERERAEEEVRVAVYERAERHKRRREAEGRDHRTDRHRTRRRTATNQEEAREPSPTPQPRAPRSRDEIYIREVPSSPRRHHRSSRREDEKPKKGFFGGIKSMFKI
ncbi:hypothetical protein AUEXF2481DRAFT_32126 [Aureobasidium subglaciale EXF-2481]|uniref:Uncharacterized protein n=1 Tax=Aureobasidium subglaciale (strain EXF-2481) TaxID=1043005 RepID=A0A074Y4A2_AURSE|nr:uncharacterized protein AUEXF2481DRAFT_32126 [Aureobasidium subglaciale EXF-2481]KEQ92540.1 hypothetical protein AUEXF2481DRAFT_32126 [Aureobasidium subglaciale EXF-2481]